MATMSNYWDVCCKDCPDDSGLGYHCNGRPERFDEIISAAPALAALYRAAPGTPIAWGEWVWGSENYPPPCTDWFAVHAGHRIAAKSEYGYFRDQCHQRVPCPTCGHHASCPLSADHDGPCSPVKP